MSDLRDIATLCKEIDCLTAQVDTLRKERDEARREVCNLMFQKGFPTGDYAKGRGWDCFKEDGKPCQ
jgi:hypothetical protein